MAKKFKPQPNYVPTDLNVVERTPQHGFNPEKTPDTNSDSFPTFKGRMAEKNFADLFTNDDIRNKDASYIIGGRLYDAVVDASGGGDYKSPKEAVDASKTNIFVRNGTYTIDDEIDMTDTSKTWTLFGESLAGVIFKLNAASTKILKISWNVNINNITFDGNSLAGAVGINFNEGRDDSIHDCLFDNFDGSGAVCINETSSGSDSQRISIEGCEFKNSDECISMNTDGLIDSNVTNNYFSATPGTITQKVIDILAIGCKIDNNNFSASPAGIIINIASNSSATTINSNNFSSVPTTCIKITGSESISINDNILLGSDRDSIIVDSSKYIKIDDNTILSPSQTTNDAYSGIELTNTSTFNTVSDNTIISLAANKMKYGVREGSSNDDNNIIDNNTVSGAVTANISIQGASTTLIATAGGKVGFGAEPLTNEMDVGCLGSGVMALKETTTPTADTNYGKVYTKTDNKIYFQDGAGTEHEIAFV